MSFAAVDTVITITMTPAEVDTLRPAVSAQVDTLTKAVMDIPDVADRGEKSADAAKLRKVLERLQ